MAGSYEFTWRAKELEARLATLPAEINDKMTLMVDELAPRVEARMKERAPWTDRGRPFKGHPDYHSEDARAGLWASASHADLGGGLHTHTIKAGHTASYGKYLETIMSGKWAIVMPTLSAMGKALMYSMAGFLDRLDAPPVLTDITPAEASPLNIQSPEYYAERNIRTFSRITRRGKFSISYRDTTSGRFISAVEVARRLSSGVRRRWAK